MVRAGLAKPELLKVLLPTNNTEVPTCNGNANGSSDQPSDDINGSYDLGEDFVLVGQVLDKVTKAASQMKLNDSVADIVELGDFRLSYQKRQIESLQSALQAADQRIASLNELNICLEQEVRYTNTCGTLTRKSHEYNID